MKSSRKCAHKYGFT